MGGPLIGLGDLLGVPGRVGVTGSDWSYPLPPPQDLCSQEVPLSMVAAPSDDPHCPQWRSNCLSPTEEQEWDNGE